LYLLYFDPTSITWVYLVLFVTTSTALVGNFLVSTGIVIAIQQLNQFILSIPVLDMIGGFFDQNLLLGYGGITAILLILFIIYKLVRRRMNMKKKKRQKA